MLGGQSRGLLAANRMAGWDGSKIPARGDQPEVSIADFDRDPVDGRTTGRLPADVPDQRALGHTGPDTWKTHYQSMNDRHLDESPMPAFGQPKAHVYYEQPVDYAPNTSRREK